MNDIKNAILEKIQRGEVSMRPRWHFVLHTAFLVVGALIAAVLSIYLASFILYALMKSGLVFAPQFGAHGFMFFVASTPWILIGLVGVFLGILYLLVTKFSWSYRQPLIYSLIGVVLLVIAASSFIQYMEFHSRVRDYAERNGVPGIVPFFERLEHMAGRHPEGVTQGTITETIERGFMLESDKGQFEVIVSDGTRHAPDMTFAEGTEVFVFGEVEGDTIEAFGVRSGNDMPLHRGKGGRDGVRGPRPTED